MRNYFKSLFMVGLSCLDWSPEKPVIISSTSSLSRHFDKKLLPHKPLGSSSVDQKDRSVTTEDVANKIVLKISTGSRKLQSDVKKHASFKKEGSERDNAHTEILSIDKVTQLPSSEPAEYKKSSPDKGDMVASAKKPRFKVKKHDSSSSKGHGTHGSGDKKILAVDTGGEGHGTHGSVDKKILAVDTGDEGHGTHGSGDKKILAVDTGGEGHGTHGSRDKKILDVDTGGEGHGTHGSGNKKILAVDTGSGLPLNQPGEYKKASPDEDCTVAHGVKSQSKMKKLTNSKRKGHGNRDGTSTEKVSATGKVTDSSLKQTLSDKDDGSVAPAHKPQSKANGHMSSKHKSHDAGDGSNAKVTSKALDLPLSPQSEHKKLTSSCSPVQKSKVKKHDGSNSKEHGTKNITKTKKKAVDEGAGFPSSLPEHRKSSFDIDSSSLSRQKAKSSERKHGGSVSKLHETGDSTNTQKIPGFFESTDFPLNQPTECTNSSWDSRRTEQLKIVESVPDSEFSQGSHLSYVASLFSEGLKCAHPTKNALKEFIIPKRKKSDGRTKVTTNTTGDPLSEDHLRKLKRKFHQRSLSDPHLAVHHQRDSSDISAVADSFSHLSQHPKTSQHQQKHASDYLEPNIKSAEKPEYRSLTLGAADMTDHCIQHPETPRPQNYADKSMEHQVDSVAFHSTDAVQAEKPKSKVLSLADYKKRKSDPKSTAVSLSSPTKVKQVDPLYMTSSLAEQLIISYAERSETVGCGSQSKPLPKPLYPLDDTHDHALTVKQSDMQFEKTRSFDDDCNFHSTGHGVWPPVQQRGASVSYTVYNTTDGQVLPLSCDTSCDQVASDQLHIGNVSGDGKCLPDYCQNVAETIEKESECSSNIALKADHYEKTDSLFESTFYDKLETVTGSGQSWRDNDKGETPKGVDASHDSSKHTGDTELQQTDSGCEVMTKFCETVPSNSDAVVGPQQQLENFVATTKQEDLTFASDRSENFSDVEEATGLKSRISMLLQTLDSDYMSDRDESQFVPVSSQDTAAEFLMKGSQDASVVTFSASVSVSNLHSKLATVTEEHAAETEISLSCDAAEAAPLVYCNKDPSEIQIQRQLLEEVSDHKDINLEADNTNSVHNDETTAGFQYQTNDTNTEHALSPEAVKSEKETAQNGVAPCVIQEDTAGNDNLQDSLNKAKLLVFKAKSLVGMAKQDVMKTQTTAESRAEQHYSDIDGRTSEDVNIVPNISNESHVKDFKADVSARSVDALSHSKLLNGFTGFTLREITGSDIEGQALGMYVWLIVFTVLHLMPAMFWVVCVFLSFFSCGAGICSLRMLVLRPASQAGPMNWPTTTVSLAANTYCTMDGFSSRITHA